MNKRWIAAIVLLALAGAGLALWQRDTPAALPAGLAFEPVTRRDLTETVTAQGKLEPKSYVDVGAQVSGQLSRLHVEIGDVVEKGQLIAEIDPRIYASRVASDQARIASLTAQLAQQQAVLQNSRLVLERNRGLIAEQATSREQLEQSEADVRVAEAAVKSFSAQIEEAISTLNGDQTNLGYTKIFAPMAGTVVTQTSREGQTLNANQMAPVIVQIADLDTMTVRAQVAEADVMRIRPGTAAEFTTLGALERRWQATVRQVLPSPEVINDVVLYNVLVDVDNRDRQLMNGMSTQVFFILGEAKNALAVPTSALGQRRPDQDQPGTQAYELRVREGEKLATRVVQVGLLSRQFAQVRSGLAEGEQIAISRPAETKVAPRRGIF
ncbi:MAG: efflux RND transporter periplasmic adaptor subunit [Immundisolibacter sp.]|uniref:efflux RND transporter periplasmic adaptor subunit n=1 Tax=Immundisolibacter sp. TaxID=1934948 RepID=UPI0019AF9A63|nr:efflux RND transporter periplasmic adaptor subunit [Immundisolibacter sp.]MBC7161146.1 efflux RND transporter periplasmic adaptor subunit [Immundisolibacter sp.]